MIRLGQLDMSGDLVAVLAQQRREHVLAVDGHRPDPCQVIQPRVAEVHRFGCDTKPAGEQPLEADCDVAEPDGAVTMVEERAGHDADRVREVDDPRVVRAQPPHAVCDVKDDRHRAQRFREPAGSGRLLADAPTAQRDRLVGVPRGLSTDPDLEEHRGRAVDGGVEVTRQREPAVKAVRLRDPLRRTANHLEPLGVDVLQHELVDAELLGDTSESLHQLRAVRAASPDNRYLHALWSAAVSSPRRCSRTRMRSIAVLAIGVSDPKMRSSARRSPVVLQPAITASTPSVDTSSRGENGRDRCERLGDRSQEQVTAAGADPAAEHDELGVEHGRDRGDRVREPSCLDAHDAIRVRIAVACGIEDRRNGARGAHAVLARKRHDRGRPDEALVRAGPPCRAMPGADLGVEVETQKADLAGKSRCAAAQRTVDEDPGRDAGADGEQDEVIAVLRHAVDVLADRGHVDVVLEDDRRDQGLTDRRDHARALPAGELGRERQVVRARAKHTRRSRRRPG